MEKSWNFSNETCRIVSEKEKRAWFAAFVIEFIVIFILNAFTLAIYTRNRHLRKPSTYLIINLTVADLLVGTVTGSSMSFELHNLETDLVLEQDFSWQSFVQFTLQELFSVASLANISLISLERLHATLFPFRHCLVGKRVYLIIILCSWLFSLILSSVFVLLHLHASPSLLNHLHQLRKLKLFLLRKVSKRCKLIVVFNDSYVLSETEEYRIWFASYVTAIVFIVLLNAFTLATFASNHQLRKHSTYLIINLTVADLLFGTAEGLLFILEPAILERYLPCSTEEWFSWQELMLLTLYFLFPKHPHSAQNFGSLLSEERKLSLTLFIMTVASLLTILPAVFWDATINHLSLDQVSPTIDDRVPYTFDALYLFRPILNPLIYAIRM
ncbi:unnamed protein product [Porites lobata]|uniref:G-protein coupled receptors family 1 profile domain-containing protein n=1 Tax=Porites lobata TaxID=104759 RepID=A0ABN8R073_9CNID|nr:unnamed protein product [Porites lobata]